MIVRSGSKVFIGKVNGFLTGTPNKLQDVCEIMTFMAPRGSGGVAKQVVLTGVDYSSKPLKSMEFDTVDSHYCVTNVPNDKERAALMEDYLRFSEPEKLIVEPPPSQVVAPG